MGLSTHDLKPDKPKAETETKTVVVGLRFVETKCAKCGSGMYVKRAPCFIRKRGFAEAIKCVRCGHQEGYRS